jgi:hypothetical protein
MHSSFSSEAAVGVSQASSKRRLLRPWHCASALRGASEGRPARLQSCRQRLAATIGVIQMSPMRSSAGLRL